MGLKMMTSILAILVNSIGVTPSIDDRMPQIIVAAFRRTPTLHQTHIGVKVTLEKQRQMPAESRKLKF